MLNHKGDGYARRLEEGDSVLALVAQHKAGQVRLRSRVELKDASND